MKILAIDTTAQGANVALVTEEKTLAEISTNQEKNHSQTIMPMIDSLFKMLNMSITEIDYIAVSNGPGSFTGLRIGISTAKGLAHALNKKIVPVPTLDMIAYNIFDEKRIIIPIMDAKRNQVYSAIYKWEGSELKLLSPYFAEDINFIFEKVLTYKENAVFLGDGVFIFSNQILTYSAKFQVAPVNNNLQKASSLGSLAIKYLKSGCSYDYKDVPILYLRKPQAEREYESRQGGVNN